MGTIRTLFYVMTKTLGLINLLLNKPYDWKLNPSTPSNPSYKEEYKLTWYPISLYGGTLGRSIDTCPKVSSHLY